MTLDLVVAGLIAAFALWGAVTGFARQVAQAAAWVGAFFAAGPAGRFFGEPVAQQLKSTLTVGVVVATVAAFLLVYLLGRALLTAVLRRLVAGGDPERRGADRALGFGLGGLKAAALAWVGLSAVTFVEQNLVLRGKKYAFTPKDSQLVGLARQWNLLELQQFSGGSDLVRAASLAGDPKALPRLKDDPDYAALMKDARFRQVVNSAALEQALKSGDVRALLQSDPLVELIHDPRLRRHLERLAERAP